jgi:hypothetical protein
MARCVAIDDHGEIASPIGELDPPNVATLKILLDVCRKEFREVVWRGIIEIMQFGGGRTALVAFDPFYNPVCLAAPLLEYTVIKVPGSRDGRGQENT